MQQEKLNNKIIRRKVLRIMPPAKWFTVHG